MKKNAHIVADEGENRVEVDIRFKCRNGLTKDVVLTATSLIARFFARQPKDIPYSDFGEREHAS